MRVLARDELTVLNNALRSSFTLLDDQVDSIDGVLGSTNGAEVTELGCLLFLEEAVDLSRLRAQEQVGNGVGLEHLAQLLVQSADSRVRLRSREELVQINTAKEVSSFGLQHYKFDLLFAIVLNTAQQEGLVLVLLSELSVSSEPVLTLLRVQVDPLLVGHECSHIGVVDSKHPGFAHLILNSRVLRLLGFLLLRLAGLRLVGVFVGRLFASRVRQRALARVVLELNLLAAIVVANTADQRRLDLSRLALLVVLALLDFVDQLVLHSVVSLRHLEQPVSNDSFVGLFELSESEQNISLGNYNNAQHTFARCRWRTW